jgi:predicted ATPase
MIDRIQIENYKALRDVSLALTPMHVLIGPNDSGKTSILEAVAALCRTAEYDLPRAFLGAWEGLQLVWKQQADLLVALRVSVTDDGGQFEYALSVNFPSSGRQAFVERELFCDSVTGQETDISIGPGNNITRVCRATTHPSTHPADSEKQSSALRVHAALEGVHSYRWNPAMLALPVAPDSQRRFRMQQSGFGLALCLDDILGFDRDRFIALEDRFKKIFPQVRSIKLVAMPAFKTPPDDADQVPLLARADGKGIYFELVDGEQLIAASQVSDGMLLVLAYLTVLHLPRPPRILLVEEPENGVHPKRLRDVLAILRDLVAEQNRSQVLLTTHSPYVVDQFGPDEVTLCQKAADGSVAVRLLSESETVREQLDIFTLGEIWTAEGEEGITARIAATGTAS